eukprot:524304_1
MATTNNAFSEPIAPSSIVKNNTAPTIDLTIERNNQNDVQAFGAGHPRFERALQQLIEMRQKHPQGLVPSMRQFMKIIHMGFSNANAVVKYYANNELNMKVEDFKRYTMVIHKKPEIKTKSINETENVQRMKANKNKATKTQENSDIRAKYIAVKKDMARLRRENQQRVQGLIADVELFKRHVNDYQDEAAKWKEKAKQCQNVNQEKYTKQFQTLRSQITELKRQREREEQEKMEYCKKNKELMMHVSKARALNEITMKKVKTFDLAQEIVIDKDIMQKQKELDEKIQINEKQLNDLWKSEAIVVGKPLETSDKTTTHLLLDRYMECTALQHRQQIGMKNAVAQCAKLSKTLKEEGIRCAEMVSKIEKEHQHLNTKYRALHAKRMKQRTQWMDALKEMNKTIDDENKANNAQCCAANQFNIREKEAKQWNVLSTRCEELAQKYQSFECQNEQNMQKTCAKFDILWNTSIKHWFEWTADDIIGWIKYLKLQKQLTLSNEFDFDHVLNEMATSKMNGLSLATVDKSVLKT